MTERNKPNPFVVALPPNRLCKKDPEIARMIADYQEWSFERNSAELLLDIEMFEHKLRSRFALLIASGKQTELDPLYNALNVLIAEANSLA